MSDRNRNKRRFKWLTAAVATFLLSACAPEHSLDCGNPLADQFQRSTLQEAREITSRIAGEALPSFDFEELVEVWESRFDKNCNRAHAFAKDPKVRLTLAHIVVQGTRNRIFSVDTTQYFEFARTQVETHDRSIVVLAMMVMSFSEVDVDKKLLVDIMQSNIGDSLIVHAGVLGLSFQCDPTSNALLEVFLERNDHLREEPRISSLLQSASEICEDPRATLN